MDAVLQSVTRQWNESLLFDNDRRRSELCKAKDVRTDWYKRWCAELKELPRYHRKQWEYVYIMQALWERECIAPGKKGVVFAVGEEQLPAIFAKHECEILATDIFPEEGIIKGWNNGQLCFGKEMLNTRWICEPEQFDRRVNYRAVDMNDIPSDINGYDFSWSSCSFEHLGTLEKGASFLSNQLNTLKPGGWAVHTTEYNVSSNDETQENNNTVIYRQRDIDKIVCDLKNDGHFVEEVDYSIGGLPQDYMVDFEPHKQEIHLKLQIDKYVVTSIGLIIQKRAS